MTTATVQAIEASSRPRPAPRRDRPLADSAARAAWESAVLDAEAEAGRHADGLHNGLMQSLVVIRHALEWQRGNAAATANRPESHGEIPAPDDAVRACLAETRTMLWHLRPRVTTGSGLSTALEELSARLLADGGPTLRVESVVGDLTTAQAVVIYRAVQERARAAGSGELVHVRISRDSGAVVIEVEGPAYDGESVWTERGAHLGVHLEGDPR